MAAIPGGLKAGASFGLENNGATTSFPHILAAAVKLRLLNTDSQREPAITTRSNRLQYLQQRCTDLQILQLSRAAVRQSRLGNPLAKGQGPGQTKKENITLLRRQREEKRKRSRGKVPTVFDTRGVAEEDVVLYNSANGGSVKYFCHLIFLFIHLLVLLLPCTGTESSL